MKTIKQFMVRDGFGYIFLAALIFLLERMGVFLWLISWMRGG